jgi:small subunit ribosomal protein S17
MADDETTEIDPAKAAEAEDAEQALEAVEAEAATELPVGESTEGAETTPDAPAEAAEAAPAPSAAPAPAPAAKAEEPVEDGSRPNRRKVREGIVVSDAMTSTVVVAVVERVRHPRYGKTVQRTKRLYVHDAEDSAKVGDRVRVQECRPMSKLKRWRLTEVVERAR